MVWKYEPTKPAGSANASSSGEQAPSPSSEANERGSEVHPSQSTEPSHIDASTDNGPVYFWRPADENGYLGHMYRSPWEHEGVTYESVDLWITVQKAKLFGDDERARRILNTSNPRERRALGRITVNFDSKIWDANKIVIATEGNYLKFTQSANAAELRARLLATGDRELVEASFHSDWGIGYMGKHVEKKRAKWGKNLSGKALMDVRARLREEGYDELHDAPETT